jgi:hypothetical protein
VLNRFLLLITPSKGASLLAISLAVVAFLLGFLEMLTREFDAASEHLHLSLGIVALLMLLKYFSLRATHQIAIDAQKRIQAHIMRSARPVAAAGAESSLSEVEVRAKERVEMQELSGQLRSALDSMAPDSPMRPKYEATVEWIERVMRRDN